MRSVCYSPALLAASNKTRAQGQQRRPLSVSPEDVSDKLDVRLRKDVKLLGGILGRTIEKHSGGLPNVCNIIFWPKAGRM